MRAYNIGRFPGNYSVQFRNITWHTQTYPNFFVTATKTNTILKTVVSYA